jgi:hypothetical protein
MDLTRHVPICPIHRGKTRGSIVMEIPGWCTSTTLGTAMKRGRYSPHKQANTLRVATAPRQCRVRDCFHCAPRHGVVKPGLPFGGQYPKTRQYPFLLLALVNPSAMERGSCTGRCWSIRTRIMPSDWLCASASTDSRSRLPTASPKLRDACDSESLPAIWFL